MKIMLNYTPKMHLKYLLIMLIISNNAAFGQTFDIQGHRGCRGLLPENTIEAMLHAIDLGVTTLELDVIISGDKQVVVSHEPFLSSEICLDKDNNEIKLENEKTFNLYQMNYNDIKQCDCGSKIHERFPNQTKLKTYKPLLTELIDKVEAYVDKKYPNKTLFYNIETKCTPQTDDVFHPKPAEFVDLLMDIIQQKGIAQRVFIQSFDVRSLQYLHQKHPQIKTVLLVENEDSLSKNLKTLGYLPHTYSPYYPLVTPQMVKYLHKKGVKIVPWTVNEPTDMQKLIALNIDGLISDYPNRYFDLLQNNNTNSAPKLDINVVCSNKNGNTFNIETQNNQPLIVFDSPAGYGKATIEVKNVEQGITCIWNFDKLEGFSLYLNPNQSISFFEYEGKMEKTIKNDNPNNENQLLQNISIEIVKNNNASKRKNDYVLHLPKEFLTKFATFDVQWIDYYR